MATHSPSADPAVEARAGGAADPTRAPRPTSAWRRLLRRAYPRTLQARLTLGFVGVVGVTLVLVSALLLYRLDDYFIRQERADLAVRANNVLQVVVANVTQWSEVRPVVGPNNVVDRIVAADMNSGQTRQILADYLAQSNVTVTFGLMSIDGTGQRIFVPAANGTFNLQLEARRGTGQTRESINTDPISIEVQDGPILPPYAIQVQLSNPYTFRAATIAAITSLFVVIGLIAMSLAFVAAALLARRFAAPLRRLTEASRALAEGDLGSRVPESKVMAGSTEIAELSRQFNAMAARLEDSVDTIRRDRDRSRDFLADVSHELRTPIAALRTFNELITELVDDDPEARAEFLEASSGQLERLDWLAQNLLDLSKLDSGLVLLDLRPDDLRGTVEAAFEQAEPSALRRGIELTLDLPSAAVRIRHDPQRIGQVVSNLVGNALKFTPRGGRVDIILRPRRGGAVVEVADTGVGIDATELPRIFDRFYRGSRANEARGSGSGLGLAIVKSIVDMHAGRISVESRIGRGTQFRVILPTDPREADGPSGLDAVAGDGTATGEGAGVVEPAIDGGAATMGNREVANSSPTEVPPVNQPSAG